MEIVKRIGRLDKRTLRRLWLPLLIAAIVLVYPFQTTVVPAWQLRVVDDTGLAVAGIKVTEHWQHNSLESVGHEDFETTDRNGRVSFPARPIRSSLFARALGPLLKTFKDGNRALLGPYASVVLWGNRNYETGVAIYKPGEVPISEIVVGRIK
jgi:hypothetical protein